MSAESSKFPMLVAAAAAAAVAWWAHRASFDRGSWTQPSRAYAGWEVQITNGGATGREQHFNVRDTAQERFNSIFICNVFEAEKFSPRELHWSKDGSLAAITLNFRDQAVPLYGCAYDFRVHEGLQSSVKGLPLKYSQEFDASIRNLFSRRGGVADIYKIPDASKQR
jgi:hypothetical protein